MPESPLAEVVRDRRVNKILEGIRTAVREGHPISIPPKDVDYIRRGFYGALAVGERQLLEFTKVLLKEFAPELPVSIALVVWGRCRAHADARLEAKVDLTSRKDEILFHSDELLAGTYSPICSQCQVHSDVIASFLIYEPEEKKSRALCFFQTRIKSPSNTCYKIADMVFDIDYMFRRDKIYNEYSQIVTDMYGIKAVVYTENQILPLVQQIRSLEGVSIVEEKDYTGIQRKESGFEAYKIVVRKDLQLFEIQVQSQRMYETEQSSQSASHKTYKERQMTDRRKLGKEYRDVYQALCLLFATPVGNVCETDYVELGFGGKGSDDDF